MKTACGGSDKKDEAAAVEEALAAVKKGLGDAPKLVTVFTTGNKYDKKKIFKSLKKQLDPDTRIWGLNSDISGVILPDGIHSGISLMGFYSPDLVVGVGTAPLDWKKLPSYKGVGKKVIKAVLKDAGKKASEQPKIILFAGPSLITDTDIYHGIQDAIGEVPICGGNTGRNVGEALVPGDGYVFSSNGAHENTVSVVAFWMKSKASVAYGYSYKEHPKQSGIVTKSDVAKRIVYEIDNKPAAEVFNEWIGGKLSKVIEAGGGAIPLPILGTYQLKKPIVKGSPDYVLTATLEVYKDKSLFITHEALAEGTKVTLMELAPEQDIISLTSIVATKARNRGTIPKKDIAGALVVYCYALLYTAKGAGYDVNPAFPVLSRTLVGAPYSGFFAGGEIGYSPHFQGEGNRMMASSNVLAIFGKS